MLSNAQQFSSMLSNSQQCSAILSNAQQFSVMLSNSQRFSVIFLLIFSPDTMAPVALGRPPAKDDPIRVYNRDLAVSSSTVSTTSSSRSSNAVLAPSSSNMAKSGVNSKKTEETNGYR